MDKAPEGALALYRQLSKENVNKNAVLLAYRGAALAASAKSAEGVFNKLECFKSGTSEIEKAVAMSPTDVEILFIKLATQEKAPRFLMYFGDIEADKAYILKRLEAMPANCPNAYLYQRICQFLLINRNLDKSEKNLVNQLVVKFKQN